MTVKGGGGGEQERTDGQREHRVRHCTQPRSSLQPLHIHYCVTDVYSEQQQRSVSAAGRPWKTKDDTSAKGKPLCPFLLHTNMSWQPFKNRGWKLQRAMHVSHEPGQVVLLQFIVSWMP